ncbi:hypothetical protein BDZ85DRAFT_135834 [Elsinoe ampelina]|uniref:Uncharacterized protein n=1 Tax=Elsinoe ampelina TaxID=302913 RepID=A0A6A6G8D4_9PEZI|nr:hypothetical protein BDZ85DRAFT_135834 [Elsinoe ampelina]
MDGMYHKCAFRIKGQIRHNMTAAQSRKTGFNRMPSFGLLIEIFVCSIGMSVTIRSSL